MWRYAVITHLRAALKANVLKSDLDIQETQVILSKAYERYPRWIIFIDKVASKSHFLRYAARYVRRPPIASWRLLKVMSREVEFVAKDTKAKRLIRARCQLSDFVRLLASHVPDKSKKTVRYFGLWAPRAKGQSFDALLSLLGETRRAPPPWLLGGNVQIYPRRDLLNS
jgi:Putative transposase